MVSARSVFIRPGTADPRVFDEVFVDREYEVDAADPSFVVDVGAHMGLSSVYFAAIVARGGDHGSRHRRPHVSLRPTV
jgi:hypothetical protein